MKKIVFILITVLCMCCMVACGGEVKEDVSASSSNEVPDNSANDQPVVTEAPVVEPEVTPAPAETTPEPTEEPSVVYEGIDMNSTLPGQDWLETFVGVIDEPKVVVFSDITGKKVIVEQDAEVTVNPDEDAMALFFPEGYTNGNVTQGIARSYEEEISTENYLIFYLDSEEMRAVGESKAAFLVMKGDERIVLIANLKIK